MTKDQKNALKATIHEWTSIGLVSHDAYIKAEYPLIYEAYKRIIEAEKAIKDNQSTIDILCDEMQESLNCPKLRLIV